MNKMSLVLLLLSCGVGAVARQVEESTVQAVAEMATYNIEQQTYSLKVGERITIALRSYDDSILGWTMNWIDGSDKNCIKVNTAYKKNKGVFKLFPGLEEWTFTAMTPGSAEIELKQGLGPQLFSNQIPILKQLIFNVTE